MKKQSSTGPNELTDVAWKTLAERASYLNRLFSNTINIKFRFYAANDSVCSRAPEWQTQLVNHLPRRRTRQGALARYCAGSLDLGWKEESSCAVAKNNQYREPALRRAEHKTLRLPDLGDDG